MNKEDSIPNPSRRTYGTQNKLSSNHHQSYNLQYERQDSYTAVVFARCSIFIGRISSAKVILWERIKHVPAEEEIKKLSNCIMRQSLNWNCKGKRKRGIPKKTLRQKLKTDVKRMNSNWNELERIIEDRVE
ncbi:unnamed protein product [Schistosoma curassoni]|uniref:Reverse transcriptase domain-containing protein n=1 Tax=Schistosoma curassoni TaxID=6186 RepID=A0A183KAT9_9TREM|nr:unnamed protein product [Schistosoma curassoni]